MVTKEGPKKGAGKWRLRRNVNTSGELIKTAEEGEKGDSSLTEDAAEIRVVKKGTAEKRGKMPSCFRGRDRRGFKKEGKKKGIQPCLEHREILFCLEGGKR